jgi:pimeloyl-ACP methyl ester carboxylesterase
MTESLMTEVLYSPKIKPEHLARRAIVYLRQSSPKQVRENKESQRLQYDVAARMRALGWKEVEVIGSDLGSSAAIASANRLAERVSAVIGDADVKRCGAVCHETPLNPILRNKGLFTIF